MFKIEDSGEDRRMVSRYKMRLGRADKVVGESQIEIENVPYLVTDEGYEAAREGIGLRD